MRIRSNRNSAWARVDRRPKGDCARAKHLGRAAAALGLWIVLTISLGAIAAQANAGPLLIDPTRTLAEQFGYDPPYTRNVPGFDAEGRAFIRSRNASQDDTSFVNTLDGGAWQRFDLLSAVRAAYPDYAGTVGAGGYFSARIVFDTSGRAYTVLTIRREEGDLVNVLLYSLDACRTWRAVTLPFGDQPAVFDGKSLGNVACEQFTGHNVIDGPPFIAVWRTVDEWRGAWASRNALYVVQPYFEGDTLVVPAPTLVSRRFLGMCQTAGDSSFAATVAGTTYFTWTEVTRPRQGGSPTYVAAFDRRTRTVSQKHLVARALPANDCHTTPGICLDGEGYLHLVTGAHTKPFRYAHSRLPYDITLWTGATKVLDSGWRTAGMDRDGRALQTYLSFVCDERDTLHIVFRQARRGIDALFDGRAYRALCHQSRPARGRWSAATVLVAGTRQAGYVNYYQRLAISPDGRLFLSLNYYTHDRPVPLRPYGRFRQRMLLVSDDGVVWRFAADADLAPTAAEGPAVDGQAGGPAFAPEGAAATSSAAPAD